MIALMKQYLRPYVKPLVIVVVLVFLQSIANLYLPELNADIINNGVSKGDTAYIWRIGGLMVLVTGLLGLGSIVSVYYGSKVAMAFGRDVRSALFRRVQSFAQTEINVFGAASLITRNTNDVQQVQMVLVMMLNVMIMAPITMVGGIIMAIRQDVVLSWMIVVILPLMAVIIGLMLRTALPLFRSMQAKIDRVNQVMREKLAGVRVIRAFVRTDFEERRFDEANRDLTDTQLKINRMFALMLPLLMGIFNFSTVAIIWFGADRVSSGAMPIGNLTAFLSYIMQILMSVMMAVVMFVMVPRAAASATRIKEVLDTPSSVNDPKEPTTESGLSGQIEFRDVEFRYPGAEEPVLCGVSFTAYPGETTAIVGSTGSGKSTLINLIPRLYDVTGGSILVDGVDVREMSLSRLWGRIGFIQQRAFLFSGTVASNLRYGKEDASEEELWHALSVAQGRDFVAEMPEGLEATISQGGASVSGGQRQRLAIARALIKRPEVYVFDDSFSALDFKTDSRLRAALKHETVESTVIIVAQRVSTIMDADRIIVMDGGRIVGIGRHSELMDNCETYREIVFSQLTAEEVA
ncbi:MAG: ABC transporter ATP-binding protein/permease [Actinobacteria bacterium]|nr:ABC transporter ATP-binding protein/permease [Actinomycetota bacterium]MCG2807564.1 ABC transporter ATP-binding protein/permease [Coriobacteriia bacterium]